MLIRDWRRSDLYAVAVLEGEALIDDEQYAWLWPKQRIYPGDMHQWRMTRLRRRFVTPGTLGVVVVTEASDPEWHGTPEIVGYAIYVRGGDKQFVQEWNKDSFAQWLDRHLLSWELWYSEVYNRATDFKNVKTFGSLNYDFWAPLRPDIYLGMLAISPKYQRRGLGVKLVKYGQDIASSENVPMTLLASRMGVGLYKKCGFKTAMERPVGPLTSIFMVWEPEHLKGSWLEDVGDGRAKIKCGVEGTPMAV